MNPTHVFLSWLLSGQVGWPGLLQFHQISNTLFYIHTILYYRFQNIGRVVVACHNIHIDHHIDLFFTIWVATYAPLGIDVEAFENSFFAPKLIAGAPSFIITAHQEHRFIAVLSSANKLLVVWRGKLQMIWLVLAPVCLMVDGIFRIRDFQVKQPSSL